MQKDIVRTFILIFKAILSDQAITEHVVHCKTGETEFIIFGKLRPLIGLFPWKYYNPITGAYQRTADN